MKNRRWVYVYLNDEGEYADAKYTAWPLLRVLRHYQQKFPDWTSIEVRYRDEAIKLFGDTQNVSR